MSTAVYVLFATRTLDLAWLPDDATVILVHNDDHFDRSSLTREVMQVDAPGNVGFGAGVNLALPLVEGPRAVLCNPDLALTAAHWQALTDVAADAVATIPLLDQAGSLTSVSSGYPTPLAHLVGGYRVGRWFPRGSHTRTLATRILGAWGRTHDQSLTSPAGAWPLSDRWVSGAALSIDVERLRSVDGFDERYFLYYEDVDLCARLARRHPRMRAVVADVDPGVHAVGATATGDSGRVEQLRLESAIRYADDQPGAAWSVCALLLRARLRARRRWRR